MKKVQIIITNLIFFSIFISIINYALAAPKYVGVKEGDVFIWETSYNEDILDEFEEDLLDYYDEVYDSYDYFESAINITEGLYKGQTLEFDGDEDFFKIKVEKDMNLTIQINYTGSIYVFLDIYDQYHDRIGYEHHSYYEEKTMIHTPYSGYYYINVELFREGSVVYDLQANVTDDWSGDGCEPNNNFYDAYYIWDDCFNDDELECSYGNDDYYRVYFFEYIEIMIKIDFNNTEGNLDLYFYDKNYDLVAYSNSTTAHSEQISYNPAYLEERYYIKINNSDSWSIFNNHSYTLSLYLDSYCYGDDDDDDWDQVDIEGYKIEVIKVKEEKDDKVEIKTINYRTKDITDNEKWKKMYKRTIDLYNPSTKKCYKEWSLGEIIPKNIDWEKMADQIKEDSEDAEKLEIKVTINYLKNGLTLFYDFDIKNMKTYEVYFEYNRDGILAVRIERYGGKEFQREQLKDYIYIPLNYTTFAIGGAIIGIIAAIIIIIIHKRR